MMRTLACVLLFCAGSTAAPPAGATCGTFSVVSVVFGSYDSLSSHSLDSAGSVTVSCDAGDSFSIALSSGQGTFLGRQMVGGSNVMMYNLFTDAQRSVIWGDGTNGTVVVSGSGSGTSVIYTVYGRIPGGQNLPAGAYSDSIVVTLNF
jgi:spore coat protein U-like protein